MSAAEAAPIFAALGDRTRLRLVRRLADRSPRSITDLSAGADISRQAVTRHLGVLRDAGVVRSARSGRQTLFVLEPAALDEARGWLDALSAQWDDALARLRTLVEE